MSDDARTLRRDLDRANQAARMAASAAATLADAVRALADKLALVNAKAQRTGATVTGPFAVGNTDVTITWPTSLPDTAYGVYVSITCGTAALGSLSATLKAGTKTANGCVVTVANTGAAPVGTFGLDVLGVRT